MNLKSFISKTLLLPVALCLFTSLEAAQFSSTFGVVNFKECIEKSKLGKQDKEALENLQKQMTTSLEKAQKEIDDLASKLEDKDYLDSLSTAASKELNEKYQRLAEEFMSYQNQYYQMLNQANYRMVQGIHGHVSQASDEVLKDQNLSYVISTESLFAYDPAFSVTESVIKKMDARFEKDLKENPAQSKNETNSLLEDKSLLKKPQAK